MSARHVNIQAGWQLAFALIVLCGLVAAAAEPRAEVIPEGAAQDTETAEAIPPELQDPAFDRFVDLQQARQALAAGDAALLADVAMQLVEGERILFRPHKAVPANRLLAAALDLAAFKKDRATVERLAKVVQPRGNNELANRLEVARIAVQKARASFMIPVDSTSAEAFALFKEIINHIDLARTVHDRAALQDLAKHLPEQKDLTGALRQELIKAIQEALAGLPERSDAEAEVLSKLAGTGRGPVQLLIPVQVRLPYTLIVGKVRALGSIVPQPPIPFDRSPTLTNLLLSFFDYRARIQIVNYARLTGDKVFIQAKQHPGTAFTATAKGRNYKIVCVRNYYAAPKPFPPGWPTWPSQRFDFHVYETAATVAKLPPGLTIPK